MIPLHTPEGSHEFIPVLAIGGSDNSGGAGIGMDIKTMAANHVYPMSVVTALTVQTQQEVQAVYFPNLDIIEKQLESTLESCPPRAVKIGMLGNEKIASVIFKCLVKNKVRNIVLDPLLRSSSGAILLNKEGQTLLEKFLPHLQCITPNIPEAEILSETTIKDVNSMKKAAKIILSKGVNSVIIKGGHLQEKKITNILAKKNAFFQYNSNKFDKMGLHGTGCCFASALTSRLAQNFPIEDAFEYASNYVKAAIEHAYKHGSIYVLNTEFQKK
ncbi:MAG: bifunctional hydroxymethylpyrimidine kinase/phosphomethylpyrimidine kinase [Leptospirales bacterium]